MGKKEILKNDKKCITHLFHLSDIHISKNNERHDEYMEVFNTLYDMLKNDNDIANSLIVITGDIIHEKTQLSSSQILLLKDFFVNLSNIAPVILILGNHDINIHMNVIDSISAIKKYLKTDNEINLLLEDKTYHYNNIIFNNTTMFTNKVTGCDPCNKIRVGLYHGLVSSPGFFTVGDFMCRNDIVLLGDIHKFQYLNNDKTIAYASSLIQQDKSEHPLEHGYIKWNMTDKTSNFIRVPNRYSIIKLTVNKMGLEPYDDSLISEIPTFHICYSDVTTNDIQKYIDDLKQKYLNAKFILHFLQSSFDTLILTGKNTKMNINDINNDEHVKSIMLNYMQEKSIYSQLSDNKKTIINDILCELIKDKNYNYNHNTRIIKLKSLSFSNFWSYGDNNYIDFTKYKEIIGIVGKEFSGKSAIIEAILYSIFGQTTRGNKTDCVNINKNSMTTNIKLSINETLYEIQRTRNIKNRLENDSTEVVVLLENGNNVSEDKGDLTNKKINDLMGGYDNFVNVCMLMQKHCKSFGDLTEFSRKVMLCKMYKLDIFDSILSDIRSQLIAIEGNFNKKFNRKNKKEIIDEEKNLKIFIKEKEDIVFNINKTSDILKNISHQIDLNKNIIIENELKLKEYNSIDKFDINEMNKSIDNKNNIEKELNEAIELKKHYKKKINKINKKLSKSIEEEYEDFLKNKNETLEKLKTDFDKISNMRRNIKENNININEYYLKLEKMTEQNKKNEIEELKNKLINLKNDESEEIITENYNKYKDLQNNRDKIKLQLEEIIKSKNNIGEKLEILKNHQYNPNCDFCMKYQVTKDKIMYIKEHAELNIKIDNINNELTDINKIISKLKKYKNYYEKLTESNKLKNDLNLLEKDNEIIEGKIKDLQREIDDYENNLKLKAENDKINEQCNDIKNKIKEIENTSCTVYIKYNKFKLNLDKIINTIDKKQIELEKIEMIISEYIKNKDLIEKYDNIKKIHSKAINKNNELNILNDKTKNDLLTVHNSLIRKELEIANEEESIKEYKILKDKKEVFEIIKDVFNNDGLLMNIFETSLFPGLENQINNILQYIVDFKIKLKYTQRGISILKIRNDGKIMNIDLLSGCEEFIFNLAFRLTLSEYNNYVKTNFVVIDEQFKYLGDFAYAKIPYICEYIKEHFDFAMVISHDDRIIKLYDKHINVKLTNGYSKII